MEPSLEAREISVPPRQPTQTPPFFLSFTSDPRPSPLLQALYSRPQPPPRRGEVTVEIRAVAADQTAASRQSHCRFPPSPSPSSPAKLGTVCLYTIHIHPSVSHTTTATTKGTSKPSRPLNPSLKLGLQTLPPLPSRLRATARSQTRGGQPGTLSTVISMDPILS